MTSQLIEQKFKKEINSLGEIFDFINPFFSQHTIPAEAAYCISLAVEEVFTNMVKYNKTSQNDILINLSKNDKDLEVLLVDFNVEQFEPEKISDEEMEQLRDIGAIGGRGVYLIHKMVDNLNYEYNDSNCYVKILKKTE